jgi:hypothetical protein
VCGWLVCRSSVLQSHVRFQKLVLFITESSSRGALSPHLFEEDPNYRFCLRSQRHSGGNALVWDLSTGEVVEAYSDVADASWWGGPAGPAGPKGGKGWFVVATPELLQVLPVPRSRLEGRPEWELRSRNPRDWEEPPGSQQHRGGRLGASGTAVAAEGFYHLLGEMDCLALGTGAGDGPLTFAVSDGQRLSLYSLQMPSRYCA